MFNDAIEKSAKLQDFDYTDDVFFNDIKKDEEDLIKVDINREEDHENKVEEKNLDIKHN